jgi:D-arginine dehydrogenase
VNIERLGAEMRRTAGAWIAARNGSAAFGSQLVPDIDVAALHAHYLAAMRKSGVHLTRARFGICVPLAKAGWALATRREAEFTAALVYSGRVDRYYVEIAAVRPVGSPMRRTVAQVRTDPALWLPLILTSPGSL